MSILMASRSGHCFQSNLLYNVSFSHSKVPCSGLPCKVINIKSLWLPMLSSSQIIVVIKCYLWKSSEGISFYVIIENHIEYDRMWMILWIICTLIDNVNIPMICFLFLLLLTTDVGMDNCCYCQQIVLISFKVLLL